MHLCRVEDMREMDRRAIEEFGIPETILMENAGHAAFRILRERFGVENRRIAIFCGGGNNGGDGLVVARNIHSAGGRAEVILLADPDRYRGAAAVNWTAVRKLGIASGPMESAEWAASRLETPDTVVDALFGTGLDRDVEGRYRDAIERINASGKPVLSLDIPSGIHGDTGRVMGVAVRADATIAFGLPKTGNLLHPGAGLGGELFVSHISFPPELYRSEEPRIALNEPPPLPERNPNGHKGSFGDVLFVAGAAGYYGAPFLSAMAFLKSGGGYARLAAPVSIVPVIAGMGCEMVFVPQRETASGSIAPENRDALLELAARVDMVVLGPGISLDEGTADLARDLAASVPCPLLLDGDGITAIARAPESIRNRTAPTVLTPHPGEMARLTGLSVDEVEADRVGVLEKTVRDLDAFIVLKGAHSLVGTPDGRVVLNRSGNAGMATPGSGDVLAGTIAGMVGLGMGISDAVCKGVFLHGLAGDMAAERIGADGLTARDILHALPEALRLDRIGLPAERADRYRIPVVF